jgi:hypothetical protein
LSRRVIHNIGPGLLLAALAALSLGAQAHTRSESNYSWRISGPSVRLTMTIPDTEIIRIPGPDGQTGNILPNNQILAYLTERIKVTSKVAAKDADQEQDCPASPAQPLSAAANYHRFEFAFQCQTADGIQLHSGAFFDLVNTHSGFAQIQPDGKDYIEQIFTIDHQTIEMDGDSEHADLQNASFFQYVYMGMMHIFTGVDHMSFLIGLVLIARRLRDLVFVITGFTLGHCVTLALAVTGVLRPQAEYIDALVGLTIALIGAENVAVATRRPGVVAAGMGSLLLAMTAAKFAGWGGLPTMLTLGAALFSVSYLMISGHLRDAGRLRLVVTLVFGLIHGFGFAANLMEMKLPPNRLGELLFGFNIGVEIGQLTLVLGAIGVVAVLKRVRLALPRPIVVDVASACLVGVGLFWFFGRSYI